MRATRRQLLAMTGGIAVAGGCLEAAANRDHLVSGDDILAIAHRGSPLLWPENTMKSITNSIETGADMVEFDFDVTADGELVVIHDRTVDRTTEVDGSVDVNDLTLEEVQELDAGYNFPPEQPEGYEKADVDHEHVPPDEEHPYRGEGIYMPTVREVFETVPKEFPLLIEPKHERPDPSQIASLIREFDREETTLLGAFESPILEEIREEIDLETGLGAAEVRHFLLTQRASEDRYDPPGEFLFAPHEIVRESLVDRAHRNGLSVLPWTVNDPIEMRRLIEAGVDGILTDDHILLKQILDQYE